MRTVFVLSSGRSGTTYLYKFVKANTTCTARHEPYFDWGNPTMFGLPIYDNALGRDEILLQLLGQKKQWIERHGTSAYFETNHALLKAADRLLAQVFPQAWYVHAVRDPLKVAMSEANRAALIHKMRSPVRNYRADDGKHYFRWELTGMEPIFRDFPGDPPSRFQWYLLQWIEIENRAMRLLQAAGATARCYFLHTPADLRPENLLEMLEFLGIEKRPGPAKTRLRQNRTPGAPTVIDERTRRELTDVVERLPQEYLEIFRAPPYESLPWSALLRKQ